MIKLVCVMQLEQENPHAHIWIITENFHKITGLFR